MKKFRKSIWCRLLTAWMILTCITLHAPAQSQSTDPKVIGLAPCIAAGVIIGIGIAGVVIIYKACQKLPPPSPPPPPPPVTSTNAPPKKSVSTLNGPPIPPDDGCTNCPPSTNAVVFAPIYWVPQQWVNAGVAVTNSVVNVSYYDASSFGWMDTNGTTAAPIYGFATGVVSNLQSSVDLVNWSNYTFNLWASTNGLFTVLYDGSGKPVGTNYVAGNPSVSSGPTAQVPFGVWITADADPTKFFRVVATP